MRDWIAEKTTDMTRTCSSNGRTPITKPGIGMGLVGRWRRGRPRQIWNEDVAKLTRERSQSEEDAENHERFRLRARKL
jgi:hypothetical protein